MGRCGVWTRREFVRGVVSVAVALVAAPFAGLVRSAGAVAATADDVLAFVSRPDLHPPRLRILKRGRVADGYLFLAPSSGPGQRGVMIVDEAGELVWFHPTTPQTAMNFRAARFRGEPVLTWWEGTAKLGLGTGTHVILDSSYRVLARVPAAAGRQSDLHEFLITPDDTALLTSYEIRTADLSAVGGPPAGPVIGGIVQELALPSGKLIWEWRSLDHVAVSETHAAYAGHPLDYFHINSIDQTADGNLLVSARNTWAVYKIDRRNGKVIWRLGGKRSDFKMGPGTVFAWQHDARRVGNGRISIFDDGAEPQVEPQSRALLIELDGNRGEARLVRRWVHRRRKIVSRYMGNAQLLANGNLLVGWGSEPYLTEFGPDGSVRLDAKLPTGGQNYRAFRLPWQGHPHLPPQARYRYRHGKGHLYVSWNGATEVTAWRLDSGNTLANLQPGGTTRRAGFETPLPVPAGVRWARAVALDQHDTVLGHTQPIRV